VILAFQVELAVLQGRIAEAEQQAARFEPIPPLSPSFGVFSPHLTLVKVWLAQDTPSSREQADDLLGRVREYYESTHNTRFLIEALALQAVLYDVEGDDRAALSVLELAISLAEPGGFIRLFVDMGPSMAPLLNKLRRQGVAPDYTGQVLAAFPRPAPSAGFSSPSDWSGAEDFIEPLTPRELEVLVLLDRHLTHKEIAAELVVSYGTVKTHALNIYRKLNVSKRREAVAKAKELGLIEKVSTS
jgi:LuxR family maltose regulon positive regulatory protein